ncbi:OX-2 membrane glycoprotein isoform X1 [Electrophorus electricus]|uniref:OX-2 membrane glycoprotein isoform X1 n=2 Tax=Electrophorus electricus TaxID=8005 RepID=UPI000F0A12E4|nr:OX-2 membrane glycoprotein isoform X1 [Electrophorus electricus]XP_026861942.1 OX-2 membrane glycoprotein isoform X1 [Electrophorus electricus]
MALKCSTFLSLLTIAYSTGIMTKGDVTVLYGQDGVFYCSIPDATGIKQVIWQRLSDDKRPMNLAIFSERFEDKMTNSYVSKFNVTLPSLNVTTLVIKNVTFGDEACFICRFDVYPSGTKQWKQCLNVQGLSETTASEVLRNPTETDVVISCSTTGKPTPTISWRSEEKELTHYSRNFTVLNHDRTTTTTSNLTLPLSQFHAKIVECVAESGSMKSIEPISLSGSRKATEIEGSRYYICSGLVVVVFVIIFVAIAFQKRMKKHEISSIERI